MSDAHDSALNEARRLEEAIAHLMTAKVEVDKAVTAIADKQLSDQANEIWHALRATIVDVNRRIERLRKGWLDDEYR